MMVEWWNTLDISMDFVVNFKAYDQIGTMNATALTKSPSLNMSIGYAAQPVVDPIWRGCYKIWNNKYTLDGVVAHLFDKANNLWPKYFNTPEATVDDIELIFFPSEASMVEDMIGGEHALRALTPYGELLKLVGRMPTKMLLMGHFKSDARDAVNDRAPTEDDAQVMTDKLGGGKTGIKVEWY
ncbi:hypothetical protein KY284_032740 [Solanum tuberosum]|nr:hypothetical protein KY284_032740 [Solanum tuberosum]